MLDKALVYHPSTNSSYYCYCAETEKLLIPISISHQGPAQLQSHLKLLIAAWRAGPDEPHLQLARSTSADHKSEVRSSRAQVQVLSAQTVISGDLSARYSRILKVHAICSFICFLVLHLLSSEPDWC